MSNDVRAADAGLVVGAWLFLIIHNGPVQRCWNCNSEERPKFDDAVADLEKMKDLTPADEES